ncbi:MAG: hypothetical protein A4E20_08905 [Nitrospira sp. SG-bin2]|uniref:DNA adenine methylase n=1 Tax=Nitrospira cf. moscoviensis SBR1015 TaxID=96242 RepID=UPI000A0B7A77|nr:DNA adenine methylase [Nitrospira cf. moscoviensis SBR1015]OQW35850.1 MAG: hypothetical protein A4E20_08905 [Nitrospira sp. SG-bin2]
MIASPLKYHGGKSYLASKIVTLMPEHTHYVEPYAGGLSVLLAKDPEGVSEVINDLNKHVTNFWSVLRAPHAFAEFQRCVEAQPFCEADWKASKRIVDELLWNGVNPTSAHTANVLRAFAFFVCCRQSLAGRMQAFAPRSRTRTRRGMNEQVSAWLNAVEGLPAVHARLKRVLILNRPALEVIKAEDGPRTLYYLDPPYVHSTRATTGEYAHEMTEEQHIDLLRLLGSIKGRFLLSGYRSDVYDYYATNLGWNRHDFELPNNAAGGKEKRRVTECLWTNY